MGDESGYNVDSIRFMKDERILIFQTRSLTKFCQRTERLVDQRNIVLIYKKSNEARTTRIWIENAIKKNERLRDQVISRFVSLLPKEALIREKRLKTKEKHCYFFSSRSWNLMRKKPNLHLQIMILTKKLKEPERAFNKGFPWVLYIRNSVAIFP